MSEHGGMIGSILALAVFAKIKGKNFWTAADFTAPLVPLGLFFGRLGNFINGELWGRLADPELPWAMIFPQSGSLAPRHPSQLYEAGLEGLALFTLLWWVSVKPRRRGVVSALFCIGYGVVRFIVEFFREPDAYLGLGLFGLSRGQWLSLPLILLGAAILLLVSRRTQSAGEA